MLIELLRVGGVELGRRWLAALALVPPAERAAVVEAVERRIVQTYASGDTPVGREDVSEALDSAEAASPLAPMDVQVVHAPVQRRGYVEQRYTTYEVAGGRSVPAQARRQASSQAGAPVRRQGRAG